MCYMLRSSKVGHYIGEFWFWWHYPPGLRIAPPEALFGKGVHFADMFSKSANYCCASKASRSGVLLLCEVWFVILTSELCSCMFINLRTQIVICWSLRYTPLSYRVVPNYFVCKAFAEFSCVDNAYLTLISQVALGDMNELLNGDYNANNLPKGKLRSITDTVSFSYSTIFS